MPDKSVRQLTSRFRETKELIAEHNILKRQLKKIDRKLLTLENKYKFLSDIVSIGGHDTVIELATKKLLKSAGFREVKHLKNVRPKREDLQVWCEDCLILIECKGTYKTVPPDHEVGQIKKYIDHRKNIVRSTLPVYGLTVINHDFNKPHDKRNTNPFGKYKNEYALGSSYGMITTSELLNGFILLKNGDIDFETFKRFLLKTGEIKFSGRADNT